MNQDDHDKLTRIDANVETLTKGFDKISVFVEKAPCAANTKRIDKIEQNLTWTIRAFVLLVAGYICKKLTGF